MEHKSLQNDRDSGILFALLFVTYAIIYMTKNCYSAAMAAIVSEGIMTKSETGAISAVFYLVYAPFQIIGGIAADRFKPARLVLIGLAGAAAANLLIYFAESYMAMMVIWTANGIIQFGVWPGIFKIVATQLSPTSRKKGVFYILIASSAGLLASYTSAAFITEWRNNFMFCAVTLFVISTIFYFGYTFLEKKMVLSDAPAPKVNKDVPRKSGRSNILILLRAGIPLFMVIDIIQNILNLGIKALTPVMLMESYHAVSPSLANAMNTILILASPVGMFLSRLPFFKRFTSSQVFTMVFAASVPLLVVTIFIGYVPVFLIIAVLTLLMLLLAITALFFSYITMEFEQFGCMATVAGLFNCMASLGVVLANYVFAKIADNSGWQATTSWWTALTFASFLLSAITIPVWKNFLKYKSTGE